MLEDFKMPERMYDKTDGTETINELIEEILALFGKRKISLLTAVKVLHFTADQLWFSEMPSGKRKIGYGRLSLGRPEQDALSPKVDS